MRHQGALWEQGTQGASLGGEILGFRAGLGGGYGREGTEQGPRGLGSLATCWSARSVGEATGGANTFSHLDLASGLGEPPCN